MKVGIATPNPVIIYAGHWSTKETLLQQGRIQDLHVTTMHVPWASKSVMIGSNDFIASTAATDIVIIIIITSLICIDYGTHGKVYIECQAHFETSTCLSYFI